MTNILTLADVVFQGFEIPQEIPFGGKQQLSVHKLIGGNRVIEAMGFDEDPITWVGRFRGTSAVQRAKRLDTLRVQGQPLTLTCYNMSRKVYIREFKWRFMQYYEIPYGITLEVLSNNDAPVAITAPSSETILTNDMNNAMSLAVSTGDAATIAAMTQVVNLANASGGVSFANQAQMLTLLAAAKTAADTSLNGSMTNVEDGVALGTGMAASSMVTSLQTASQALQVSSLVGRMTTNLGLI